MHYQKRYNERWSKIACFYRETSEVSITCSLKQFQMIWVYQVFSNKLIRNDKI